MPDNTVAFEIGSAGSFGSNPAAYEIRRLDGTLVRWIATTGTPTDFHDFQQLPSGNYLLATYVPRDHVDLSPYGGPSDATVLDAEIQEVRPDGTLVSRWNSKDHIALSESGPWWSTITASPPKLPDGRTVYDIVHFNSVEPDGDSMIVSLRHTDGVYRVSRADGQVQWKLGGTTTAQSLTVSGDSVGQTFSGQHDARRLGDGTLSVFDNGTRANRSPRVVRFQIDATAKTATLVESLTDGEVTTSPCCGSARRLASGGWLVQWGHFAVGTIGEYAANGSRLSKLNFPETLSYRAVPVEAGRISAVQLRSAMDSMFPR